MMITRNRKQIAVIHIVDKRTLYFDSLINFVYYRHLFPISDKKYDGRRKRDCILERTLFRNCSLKIFNSAPVRELFLSKFVPPMSREVIMKYYTSCVSNNRFFGEKERKKKQKKKQSKRSSRLCHGKFEFTSWHISFFLSSSCNRRSWSLTVRIRMTLARDDKLSIFSNATDTQRYGYGTFSALQMFLEFIVSCWHSRANKAIVFNLHFARC